MGKKILYVDNNLEIGKSTLEGTDLEFVARTPDELGEDSTVLMKVLRGIHVVLMDYDLHEEDSTSSAPIDGIEMLERFRAAIRALQKGGDSIPLLTIYTGKYDKLVEELNCPSASYLVARRANVDWVFAKGSTPEGSTPEGSTPEGSTPEGTKLTTSRLNAMLSAFERDFGQPGTDVEDLLFSFLALPKGLPWTDLAKEKVRDARPPTQIMHSGVDRATLMRWLLQVALPTPGCFVGLDWTAVRLCISPEKLVDAVQEYTDSNFSKSLDECRYEGPLADFYPVRYWKAGIDHLIWELTQGRSPTNADVRENLTEAIGKKIPALKEEAPVLLVSPSTFEQTNQIADMNDAVQIQPDIWPAEVELPWVRLSEVENDSKLRAIVVSEDRERLPKDSC